MIVLMTGVPLDIKYHKRHTTNSKKNSMECQKSKELGQIAELKRGVKKSAAQQMYRACKSRAWLTVMLSFMYDTQLSAQEFWDNI